MPLKDILKSSSEYKRLWVESIKIAVHSFMVVHKRTPLQLAITDFFHSNSSQNNTLQDQTTDWRHSGTDYIPMLI
eukprot:2075706-Ditylum_brightwellii.AAC.1